MINTCQPAAVDILMPVYNSERYIAESIESVIAQSLSNWRLIIVDDLSTDRTRQIILSYAEKDPRIVLLKGEHKGIAAAINMALSEVTADLVARLDGDDIATHNRLAVQYDFMQSHRDVVVVGANAMLIDEHGKPLKRRSSPVGWEKIENILKTRNCICHPATMIRTSALRQIGGYRDKFRTSQDYDLWLRISELGKIENISQDLLLYRRHSSQVSNSKNAHRQTLYSVGAAIDFFLRKYRFVETETIIDESQCDDLAHKLMVLYEHTPNAEDVPSLNRHAIRLLRYAESLSPIARKKLQQTIRPFLSPQQQLKSWFYDSLRFFGAHKNNS